MIKQRQTAFTNPNPNPNPDPKQLQVDSFKQCIRERSEELRRQGVQVTRSGGEAGPLRDEDFEEGGVGWFRASQM